MKEEEHTAEPSLRRSYDKFPIKKKPDGAPGKNNPNSLAATLRAIRRLWAVEGVDQPRRQRDFSKIFEKFVFSTIEKYPKRGFKHKSLQKLCEALERNDRDVAYYHLRAYADFVGVPTSLLLVFSHVVGDVDRGDSREQVMELLDRVIDGCGALKDHIASPGDHRERMLVRKHPEDPDSPYNARIEGLVAMYEAFIRERK